MRYTIAALATNEQNIDVMRKSLLAVGAPADAITTRPGCVGTSQPQISISTTDLEASESYRDALELAGGTLVSSNEESSTHNAVR